MGRIVVTEFITLDGVIEAPGGGEGFEHEGWSFKFDRGADGDKFKLDELTAADAQLLGRRTYEGFARAWPSMTGDAFGGKMNAMPKYVASTTLASEDATWNNSTVIGEDLPGELEAVKRELGGDILVAGSARLVQSLAEHDLVDEYRLMVFPVVLGSGKRLFTADAPHTVLRLVDAKPLGPDGVVLLTYAPAQRAAAEA
ncbi:MAG TPA: dihydrofolate reductase family protein [Solirubrobacteraceae bacterium]|jgi:dihydrofolate reductase|nr:dihydrofolate reductase family protein [Solirubrobacteraceae bacterium]